MFYGTGHTFIGTFGSGLGLGTGYTQTFSATNRPKDFPLSYPIPSSIVNTSIPAPAPPYAFGYIPSRDYAPPSTVQWSVALEQAIGRAQSISLSYVASNAPKLGHWTEYSFGSLNPLFSAFYAWGNGAGSNYNSLQLQYKRQAFRGLQVQAGYTWAHAIDSNSTDYYSGLPLQRGNSDNDVRHNFNAALVYDLSKQYPALWQRTVLDGWNVDLRLTVRTAFPVQVQGRNILDPTTGEYYASRLDYNGKNPYLYKKGIPGGRQFDPSVLSVPTAAEGTNGNAARNFLRGLGEAQTDSALQRTFPIYDRLHLLFRAEAFNITNHPNFGRLNVTCGATAPGAVCNTTILGQATATLSNSLQGGLASIYQQGGPRSLQLAVKLQF